MKNKSGYKMVNPVLLNQLLEGQDEVVKLRAKLAAAEKIFNHFTFDHLMKMENGEGKTPANLVQEYLEL